MPSGPSVADPATFPSTGNDEGWLGDLDRILSGVLEATGDPAYQGAWEASRSYGARRGRSSETGATSSSSSSSGSSSPFAEMDQLYAEMSNHDGEYTSDELFKLQTRMQMLTQMMSMLMQLHKMMHDMKMQAIQGMGGR